ncbi:arylesterase [Sphingomonas lenta]|uniref:Arylesterase n=1 Tax=Sphingomonas lenta TaxID=1141887 RepID=A0A2A2SHI8_9SPHN|nr:arylesterase [Sphingomonas lenta]PAX08672.1 arylesterase [Sphingomonas lenta]
MSSPSPYLLAFGDSLTAGYGLAPEMAFPKQLERRLRERRPGASVQNAGVSGDTTASGRARLPRVLSSLRHCPDLAILELGANDFLRGFAPERTRDNLDWMLEEFGRARIPVLLAGMMAPPFLGGWAQRFNAIHPDLATKHRVPLYPFFLDGVVGDRGLTLADGIHPNARAIGIVADRILPHVEAALDGAERRAA